MSDNMTEPEDDRDEWDTTVKAYFEDDEPDDDSDYLSIRLPMHMGTQSSRGNVIMQVNELLAQLAQEAKRKRRRILWNTLDIETSYDELELHSIKNPTIVERVRIMTATAVVVPWASSPKEAPKT